MDIKKSAFWISFIAMSGKCLGFFREVALSHFYGASDIADAYIMAGNIVGVLFGWIGTVYLCYTPVYLEVVHHKGEKDANRFTGTVISGLFILSVFCIILTYLFPQVFVSLVAPGFTESTAKITIEFLVVAVLILLVEPIIFPLKAYLECNKHFILSSSSDFFLSFTQLSLIFVSGLYNYRILPYAMFVPYVIQAIIVYVGSRKNGFVLKPCLRYSEDMKTLLFLIVPYFLSSLVIEINSLVDRYFASTLQSGTVSSINYASILNSFFVNVFSIAIVTILYPRLAAAAVSKRENQYANDLTIGIKLVSFIFIPITVGACLLSTNIIGCIFGHGRFGSEDIVHTSSIFTMYIISIFFVALRELLFRSLYSKKNMKLPLLIGALSTAINIVLNMILVKYMGASGLALSTSLSTLCVTPILFLSILRKNIAIDSKDLFLFFGKIGLMASVMGIVVFVLKQYCNVPINGYLGQWINLIFYTLSGGVVYFSLTFLLKLKFTKLI
jgi:integral membrane protein mviN